jgi:BMFP domain-containing protein YqiC
MLLASVEIIAKRDQARIDALEARIQALEAQLSASGKTS